MSDETWVVTLPKLGESVTEGVIGTFFKNVGDEVEFDDPLFEVSTDKVDSEVPSPYDGVVLEVLAQPGDTVSVGAPVLRIGGKGATVPNRLPSAAHGVAAAGGRSLNDAVRAVGGRIGGSDDRERRLLAVRARVRFSRSRCRNWVSRSPRARSARGSRPSETTSHSTIRCSTCPPTRWIRRSRARTTGRCWTSSSTPARRCRWVPCWHASGRRARRSVGPAGNGSRPADVESPRAVDAQTGAAPVSRDGAGGRLLSPLVRRLAAEHGIDVTTVAGTGVGGRIRREDIDERDRDAARQRSPLRPPLRQRSRHRPRRHPGRRRPAPTGGTKWCRSAECV